MIAKKLVLKSDQEVFFTSDTHYGHSNICRGTTQWNLEDHGGTLSVRDFDTLDEMNQAICDGINYYVGQDDVLFHLGDWSFGGFENIKKFRDRVNCSNIYLILGNHDHHIDRNRKGIQGIFTNVYGRLELTLSRDLHGSHEKIGTFELCHFPWAVWNKAHHGRIHLHGHTHGSFIHDGRALDVGIDRAFHLFGEYRPFTIGEVKTYMNGRTYGQISHHNKNTN